MYKYVYVTSVVLCFGGCALQKNNTSACNTKLVVSIAISGPVAEISPKENSLGLIPSEQTEIKGIIPVFNPGTEALEIKKVSGPCACFKGYSGDKVIQPGQGGEIEVRFDPAKIPAGEAKRLVRVETNDPNQPTTEVYFTFNIQRSAEQEQNRIVQSELTQLRSELRSLRQDVEQLKKQSSRQPGSASKAAVEDTRVYDIPTGGSPVLGSENAVVTIVEFSDLQCPFCIKESVKLKQILSE